MTPPLFARGEGDVKSSRGEASAVDWLSDGCAGGCMHAHMDEATVKAMKFTEHAWCEGPGKAS